MILITHGASQIRASSKLGKIINAMNVVARLTKAACIIISAAYVNGLLGKIPCRAVPGNITME